MWYNGQSVHELGQRVSVACTPSIEHAKPLGNITTLVVKTGACFIVPKGQGGSSYHGALHAGVVISRPQVMHARQETVTIVHRVALFC